MLGKLAQAAEMEEDEEDEAQKYDNDKDKSKKIIELPLQLLGRFHTAPITGIRELSNST
jgi:hypothetical protein